MEAALRALGLAGVPRAVKTLPAEIAAHSLEQARNSPLAKRTVQPRPGTAVVTLGPRNLDLLRHDLIAQFELDQVSGDAHPFDPRPAQIGPIGHPMVSENVGAL
jgi:hypothetical protein